MAPHRGIRSVAVMVFPKVLLCQLLTFGYELTIETLERMVNQHANRYRLRKYPKMRTNGSRFGRIHLTSPCRTEIDVCSTGEGCRRA
jgi:hypothetical protein